MTEIQSLNPNEQSNKVQLGINQIKVNNNDICDDLSDINMDIDPFQNLDFGQLQEQIVFDSVQKSQKIKQKGPSQQNIKSVKNSSEGQNHDENSNNHHDISHINSQKTPKKLRIKKKKDKKRREKKMKKRAQIMEQKLDKKTGSRLKKKSAEVKSNSSVNYSGQSQRDELSSLDESVDSMFANLNPRKRRKLTKKQRTQKKQGFSLKQLGDNPQFAPQDLSDGESYGSKKNLKSKSKKKKDKKQKKQVSNNQDLLKKLLEIGLCVEEQQKAEGSEQLSQKQYDDGIDALNQMKGSKKKGPKINNKFFSDMMIDENQFEHCQPPQVDLQLEVKPRSLKQMSIKSSSFLDRTEKLRKIRGMQSDLKSHDKFYEQIMSQKAKQSIIRIIKDRQIEDAEELQLNVQVPVIVRGRSSGQINNSMYFKRFGHKQGLKKSFSDYPEVGNLSKRNINQRIQSTKLSRKQLFSSLLDDVKERRSRDITHQIISKSFKITHLEQIEDMRKKNQQRRRKQALAGSDFEDQEQNSEQIVQNKGESNSKEQLKVGFETTGNKQQICVTNQQQLGQQMEYKQKQVTILLKKGNYQQDGAKIATQKIEAISSSNKFTDHNNIELMDQNKYQQLMRLEEGDMSRQYQSDSHVKQNPECQLQQIEQVHVDQIGQQSAIEIENQKPQQQLSEQHNSDISESVDNEDSKQEVQMEIDIEAEEQDEQDQQKIQCNNGRGEKKKKFLIESDDQNSQGIQYRENAQQMKPSLSKDRVNDPIQDQGIVKKDFSISIRKQIMDEKENIALEQLEQLEQGNMSSNMFKIKTTDIKTEQKMRKQFHKLRKLATIIKQKKIKQQKMKIAGQMFEQEAEQGSDNEDHDHNVKQINHDEQQKQYQGMDLDADLQQFLDNAANIYDEQNEENAFKKYMEDVKIQQKQQLKRIMQGDFKRNRGIQSGQKLDEEMEEDQKQRQKRMDQFEQYMKRREQQQGKQCGMGEEECDQNGRQEQRQVEEVDEMNEQNLKRYLEDYLGDTPKKQQRIVRPKQLLPQSYQRGKQLEKRNTMKFSKQIVVESRGYSMMASDKPNSEGLPANLSKLKKTSSHLNELIMKNKQKVRPMIPMRTLMKKH